MVGDGRPSWSAARCIDVLVELIPTPRRDYLGCRVVRQPLAYPVFHRAYEAHRRRLAHGTGVERLESIGRNGEFAHILMEDVYWRTVRRARRARRGAQGRDQRRGRSCRSAWRGGYS